MEHWHPILSSRITGKGNNSSSKDRLCIRIGITESSNILHYSNASSIEKNRRYLVIKGGLAWLLWQGGVVNSVVDRATSSGVSLIVYRGEEGGETMNTMQRVAY